MSQDFNPPARTQAMERQIRNGTIITIVLMVSAVPTAAIFAYLAYANNVPQLYIPIIPLIAGMLLDFLPLSLVRKGERLNLAMSMVVTIFLIIVFSIILLVEGLGLVVALLILIIVNAAASLAMGPKTATPGAIVAFLLAFSAFALDLVLRYERAQAPFLQTYSIYVLVGIASSIVFILFREVRRFNLQTKITLGILAIGGIIIAILLSFGPSRISIIISSLSNRYENKVIEQTEAEILRVIQSEAGSANVLFNDIKEDAAVLVQYLSNLNTQQEALSDGAYWNAAEKILQLPGGQYSNSRSDAASFYLPNTYRPNEGMLRELNTLIHLDFIAPGFLANHPEAAAVYFISERGYTIYYPNIGLAENVPPNFDPTKEPFFTIVTPRSNPFREARWTPPYQDPAGSGLIVTLSIPVYDNTGNFLGVVGVDILLSAISESISAIKLGETGFPVLLDRNGLVLAMPEEGYELFGLEPEIVPVNENPKQNIFGRGPSEIQAITSDILSGETGLKIIRPGGVETYVAYTALDVIDYRLAVIAPADELNSEILTVRAEVEGELATTIRDILILLTAMFIGAFLLSIWVGQILTRPIKQLSGAVEQITGGDLTARVEIASQDETGALARSFNIMAQRLNDTLLGLEDRIAERTSELEHISQRSAYRASQLEAIARISRTIGSTQSLEKLLPQIAETISAELGFYHTGIFLLDSQKEYAVLVAANSEGGKKMLARSHRLRVGETGIVGYAARSGEPRIALDVGLDAVYFNNPDLPETHSEAAIPLRIGDEIIGVLDAQSIETNAFSQEDINILSTLADQVAIAIQNARSYQQSLEALQQAEQIAAQLSEQQWSKFLAQQPVSGYRFDGVEASPLQAAVDEETNGLLIPLVLRGTRIGTLKLSAADPTRTWDADEIAMAQATAERTAFAIENARLLREAQKRATKERAIGEISAKIGNLVNIENILQTAIQELGNTLPDTEIAIQFTQGVMEQR